MALAWMHLTAAIVALTGTTQGGPIELRVKVKNTSPQRVLADLQATSGVVAVGKLRMRALPDTSEILLKGTEAEITEGRELIRLLDVAPRRIVMEIRLARVRTIEGKLFEETLSELRTVASNNRAVSISGSDETWESVARIVPRIHGDGSVSLRLTFEQTYPGEKNGFPEVVERRESGQMMKMQFGRDKTGNRALVYMQQDPNAGFAGRGYWVAVKLVEIKQ